MASARERADREKVGRLPFRPPVEEKSSMEGVTAGRKFGTLRAEPGAAPGRRENREEGDESPHYPRQKQR
ncbi:MAG: hypothetical protein M3R38_00075 [Actinomycetota bacterium]|nr:hypothetical protein [Actinomycetota bacterium]